MTLTSLPYVLGYQAVGEGMRFTGFVFGVEDGNSYIAKMLTGSAGSWAFRTPYTAIPQRGAPLFLPYLLLGKLVAPPATHEQLVAIYHLFRIFAGFLAILASYDFLSLFVAEIRLRRAGTVLVALGGGLGWAIALTGRPALNGSLPLEYYSPESFGFMALYGLPHLALSRALLLWGFVAYLKAAGSLDPGDTFRGGSKAGICWWLASLAQPLAGPIAGLVCIAHMLALAFWIGRPQKGREPGSGWPAWRRMVRLAIWAGLPVALWVLGNLWITRQDSFLISWMAQNKILSPSPLHYLFAYGLLLPFAAYGGITLLKREPWKGWLPVVWSLALPFLAYAPFNLQRRLVEGIWVAIVALSLAAIELRENGVLGEMPRDVGRRWRINLFAAALILSLPSTFILLAGGFQVARQPEQPAFRPADEVAVFQYIERNIPPGSVILAAYETGNALPAWAPVRVVIGHGPESAGLGALQPRIQDFFDAFTPDLDRKALLLETGAKYVFWGPSERSLGSWDPGTADFLREIFRTGDYSLFEEVEPSFNW